MVQACDLKVSIIVPGFNDQDYIARALQSCSNQTYGNIEIIAVDDGSTDGTRAAMEAQGRLDSRLSVVALDSNSGTHNARRAGLEQSTGHLVIFLDGDDELAPEACARAAEEFVRAPYDILHFSTRVISDGKVDIGRVIALQRWEYPVGGELYGWDILEQSFLHHEYSYSAACKAYAAPLVKDAFAQLGDVWCDAGEDALEYFAIASMASIYRGLPGQYLYTYHLGDGGSEHDSLDEAGFARMLRLKSSVDAMERFASQRQDGRDYREVLDFHYRDQLGVAVQAWAEDVEDSAKEACLRKLMEVWPQDDLVDCLCTYGTPAMEVAERVLGPGLQLTEEQLRAWGFADGRQEMLEEYKKGLFFRLGRLSRVVSRKAHTALRLAGIEVEEGGHAD